MFLSSISRFIKPFKYYNEEICVFQYVILSHEGENSATDAVRCNILMAQCNLFIVHMHFSLYKTVGVPD